MEDAATAKKSGIPAKPFVKEDLQQTSQPATTALINSNSTGVNPDTKPAPKEITGELKRKSEIVKQMKSSYFVLNAQGLTIYKKKGDKKPDKFYTLVDLLNVKDADSRVTEKEFSFNLVTRKKTVLLVASNEEEKQRWIAGFKQAIKEW